MSKYIMAFDQGTTSCRAVLYDKNGRAVSSSREEFTQIFPQPGFVEHDALEIWEVQLKVAKKAMQKAGISSEDIAAIGVTNQRETTVIWDKNTGKPVYNAIVWQCRRTADYCEKLKDSGYDDMIAEKTGLNIDPYFSGTKIRWILENVKDARKRAKAGELLFGTIETWLIWNLTSGRLHITDYSNAARTMLFNIHSLDWDDEILAMLDIPRSMLPKPVANSKVYGMTDPKLFGGSIPVAGAAGDQQAALFGQACFDAGDLKMTYGTGGFMLLNTGKKIIRSENGLLSTVAWNIDGKTTYALEGSIFVAGAAIQWLRDELEMFTDSAESEAYATSIENTNGVYVVPAFTGLGAPYWDPYARGIITGITRGTSKAEIIRATLESLAYQTWDLYEAMQADLGDKLGIFKVDGGACANNFLMQFQSDIIGTDVLRPSLIESTSMGAAFLAGLAVGFWKNTDEIRKNIHIERTFTPSMDEGKKKLLLAGWHEAVKRSIKRVV